MQLNDEIKEQYCYKSGFKRPRKKPSYKALYYKPFGRFIINTKFLDENKILIKYPSHAPVAKFKQHPASFQLCDFIRHMIKTDGKMCEKLYNKIPQDEIQYLEELLKISKLDLQLNYETQMYKTIYDYKERFNLLMKNIKDGNINKDIINEIKDLIEILNTKMVSKINDEDKALLMEIIQEIEEEMYEYDV